MPAPLMVSVSGCRGVLGESLTPEVAVRYAGAFAAEVRSASSARPRVVVGRDGRRGSEMVQAAATAGLAAAGCDVIDLGVAMTPTVAVAADLARRPGAPAAGVVITASHNPQEWCGLKGLIGTGGEHGSAAAAPAPDVAARIATRFHAGDAPGVAWRDVGEIARGEDPAGAHVARLLAALRDGGLRDEPASLARGVRIAVDSVNASGVVGAATALRALGCEHLTHVGDDASGVFPHPPEPTRENLTLAGGLCDAVRRDRCDVGFAQDPDADRLALIDETGAYVGEEYTLALSAMALLDARTRAGARGGLLATNLSTSRLLDDVAGRAGARVLRTPVGEAHVVEAMKAHAGIVCGGEGNGGTIWPRVCYVRDSIGAMALVLSLLRPPGGPPRRLSEVVASLPVYAIRKRKQDLPRREEAGPALDRLARAFAHASPDRRDGVWVDLPAQRAWLHVRASNTEPILRLIAEAPTAGEGDALLDAATAAMRG